ncbi:hypothetical protein BX600DRAFT_507942 [Xylariales sp. PMI_506]|nr:hypothetical protein BX600DRAFT_507942 [Xylariales sp. PMI_506]
MSERSRPEMQQKAHILHPFFASRVPELRPDSVATEIVDTDWDEEDITSDIDDDANSPRVSLNSSGQQSVTTLSSYEEAHTPRSSRTRAAFPLEFDSLKQVEGPRGPHLFRSSTESTHSADFYDALSMSPITPVAPKSIEAQFRLNLVHDHLPPRSRNSPFQFTYESLDSDDLVSWSPEMVAQWMLNAGVEMQIAEKFVENDISGAILITLKSEDLSELDIQSFGVRTTVWHHICELREVKVQSPRPETPIEDEESKEVRKERRRMDKGADDGRLKRCHSSRRRAHKPAHEDIISPLESVSIVGIEQVMPKPHKCSKGENCSKWRRQQRMIEEFKKEHPFSDGNAGVILLAGDPGNAATAPAINRPSSTEALRPVSEAVPSVVASSDVLGPGAGLSPLQYLQETTLRNLQRSDPQDNVRRFLEFQHQHNNVGSGEVPPTPPFEIYPTNQAPHNGLRRLPKLSIPKQPPVSGVSSQHRPSQLLQPFVPYKMDKAEALSPDLQTPVAPYRFGTPFSDMDVPVTAVPLGPVARDASQSVPPDMNYRAVPAVPVRSISRASRRPSFQVMASLQENITTPISRPATTQPQSTSPNRSPSQRSPPRVPARPSQPLQAPPRTHYPWSAQKPATLERTLAPGSRGHSSSNSLDGIVKDAEGVTYQGPVRKRKTKMLRHEWHDQYATLKGTRLALHKDVETRDRTLEYIDIDDYAIACSSLASSKLNAAFKAMSISRSGNNKDHDPVAAFSFQLIPQGKEGGMRLRKRDSSFGGVSMSASAAPAVPSEGSNGTGKTHHFAVRSRDERIDWMRELMLAKALRQKGEGFEVSVNGNMI